MVNPFNLNEVSDYAYFLLWLNVLFFSIGYFFSYNIKLIVSTPTTRKISKRLMDVCVFLQISLILVFLYYLSKYNYLLLEMDLAEARTIKYEMGLLFSSYIEYAFFTYFCESVLYISILISICSYIYSRKIDTLFITVIINIVLYGFIGFGRFIFFDALIFYLLASIFAPKFIELQYGNVKLRKVTNITFVTSMSIYMISFTANRLGKQISGVEDFLIMLEITIQQGLINFIGPFRAFDYFLSLNINEKVGYMFGRATFSGLEELFCNLLFLTDLDWISVNAITGEFTVPSIIIGDEQQFNAFYTGVMNSFLDGGVIGIIIISLLYGWVTAKIFIYYFQFPSIIRLALLVYFTHSAITTEYRLALSVPSTWLVLLICIVLCLNEKHCTYPPSKS